MLVVCITCNHCPVAMAYQDRIIELAKKYRAGQQGRPSWPSTSTTARKTGSPKMKERAKEKGFNFPYAYDPSQKIARHLGAARTPEFFVFNKERKLVYTGALDDSMNSEKVSKHYVVDAVEAALKGEAPKVRNEPAAGLSDPVRAKVGRRSVISASAG